MGNKLRFFSDDPHCWEAWDIDYYYKDMELKSFVSCSHEKLSNDVIKFEYKSDNSKIVQYAFLSPESYGIYFINEVDWNEERVLLRVEFPAKELDFATCAIAYGTIQRKTIVQNEEDFARFEFPSQGFVDISDSKDGAALLSDVKYGFSVQDHKLSLSLLRSPIDPDPFADLGHHKFLYCFAPHQTSFEKSSIKEISETLKDINIAILSDTPLSNPIPVEIKGEGICITAIKQTEEGANIVIRCHENFGKSTIAHLCCNSSMKFKEATLDEKILNQKEYTSGDEILFGPFEIKTFISV